MEIINIWWEGPFQLPEIENKTVGDDKNEDYGIYQIYGTHPVYGNNVLLYIGKADKQTFSTRLNQEQHWWSNQDAKNIQIYLGRLIGETVDEEKWSNMIGRAEQLLIYSHRPAHNSSNINSLNQENVKGTHVLNWNVFNNLLPEVSSMRIFDETNELNDNYFSLENL